MNARVVNPQSTLTVTRRRGEIVAMTLTAPVRGRSLCTTHFSHDQDPIIFDILRRLANGDVIDAHPCAASLARLAEVGFLVDGDAISQKPRFDRPRLNVAVSPSVRRAAWDTFAQHRYAVLRECLQVEDLTALRTYYRAFVEEGFAYFKDRYGTARWWAHNEPVARIVQAQLTDIVSEVVGEQVKPSYTYFVSYCNEAVLLRHCDRAQCAFSVSLLLDYTPEPICVSPWPLWLEVHEKEALAISLGVGDGVVYRGTELPHWRNALAPEHTSTSLLLHYVPLSFAGPLE